MKTDSRGNPIDGQTSQVTDESLKPGAVLRMVSPWLGVEGQSPFSDCVISSVTDDAVVLKRPYFSRGEVGVEEFEVQKSRVVMTHGWRLVLQGNGKAFNVNTSESPWKVGDPWETRPASWK